MFFRCLLIFFKIKIFKTFYREYHQSVKHFGSRSNPTRNFPCFFVICLYFQNQLFHKILRHTISVSNSLDQDLARHFVGPDLGLNCLQRLSANDASSEHYLVKCVLHLFYVGAQWLRGRVLDSRPRGRSFKPHWHHCIVSLSKNINPSLLMVQTRKTHPFITERLSIGLKESNKKKHLFYLITESSFILIRV